jgi:hypothetical protein
VSAGCPGGHSHAGARRCSWNKAHRAAPLAHVLWAVHCGRIFFPRTLEPATEIAFGRGARETPVPSFIQHKLVFDSHHTSTDFADFLAHTDSLHKRIQRTVDATRQRCLLASDLAFDLSFPQEERSSARVDSRVLFVLVDHFRFAPYSGRKATLDVDLK